MRKEPEIFTAIHRVLCHVSEGDLLRLIELNNDCEYAGRQLGTSAQVSASIALSNEIESIIENMPEYYRAEFKRNLKR